MASCLNDCCTLAEPKAAMFRNTGHKSYTDASTSLLSTHSGSFKDPSASHCSIKLSMFPHAVKRSERA